MPVHLSNMISWLWQNGTAFFNSIPATHAEMNCRGTVFAAFIRPFAKNCAMASCQNTSAILGSNSTVKKKFLSDEKFCILPFKIFIWIFFVSTNFRHSKRVGNQKERLWKWIEVDENTQNRAKFLPRQQIPKHSSPDYCKTTNFQNCNFSGS